jgi:predicted glycosyltransferase
MRILADICHPAHVHLFRNAIKLWKAEGHDVRITIRDKDITKQLLELYDLPYVCLSKASRGIVAMGLELASRNLRLINLTRKWRPDVMLGMASPTVAQVGALLRIPSVIFTDTESGRLQNHISFPFATRICTPQCYLHDAGRKQVRYKGYHELAYLHPNYFQPDASVLDELGLNSGERFSIVRFVGWKAMHDRGRKGPSPEQKKALVLRLAELGRVFVSSEEQLPDDLEQFRFRLPYTRMHDALAFASLIFGESSTMSSEAAMLGVPSVFVYPFVELGITQEQSNYWKILHWFAPEDFQQALDKGVDILEKNDIAHWRSIGKRLVSECNDVTSFIAHQAYDFDRTKESRATDTTEASQWGNN